MMRFRKRLSRFLERFQVQIEPFACIGERTCQCVVTGDGLRDVGKIDRAARFLEQVAAWKWTYQSRRLDTLLCAVAAELKVGKESTSHGPLRIRQQGDRPASGPLAPPVERHLIDWSRRTMISIVR